MPKEITHWLVAKKAAEGSCGTLPGAAALDHPNALSLGAVYPDVLYYLHDSPEMSSYQKISQAYHGAGGEDTYVLIRQMGKALSESPRQMALWAFLAGVVCHIQTDMTFHPLVYHLTGDYEDADPDRRSRSVKDHRRLECLMDMLFCGGAAGLKSYSFGEIIKGLEMPLPYLLGQLFRTEPGFDGLSASIAAAERALANFRILQGLSQMRLLTRFLDLLAPCLPNKVQEVVALFYSPSLDACLPKLEGPLSYQNPVTGEAETLTLYELFDRAVVRSVDCIRKIETAVVSGAPILPEKGPSLSYGVTGEYPYRPRYFAKKRFF